MLLLPVFDRHHPGGELLKAVRARKCMFASLVPVESTLRFAFLSADGADEPGLCFRRNESESGRSSGRAPARTTRHAESVRAAWYAATASKPRSPRRGTRPAAGGARDARRHDLPRAGGARPARRRSTAPVVAVAAATAGHEAGVAAERPRAAAVRTDSQNTGWRRSRGRYARSPSRLAASWRRPSTGLGSRRVRPRVAIR
jgi:hypothetical protein